MEAGRHPVIDQFSNNPAINVEKTTTRCGSAKLKLMVV
jgi:hypothetical protein